MKNFNPRVTRGPLRQLSLLRVVSALILACFAVAYVRLFLNFSTSTDTLLARAMGSAIVILLGFTLASNISLSWLPRSSTQALAVIVVSPFAMAVAYSLTIDGSLTEIWSREGVVRGWRNMSLLSIIVGLLATLTFIYNERDAEAKAQALRHALERQTLEKQLLAAELKTLQAQVEPHFLFNTLANVQQLVEMQEKQAGPLLKALISYLQLALANSKSHTATASSEFDLAKNYLAIMQMRMPDRLQYSICLPDELRSAKAPTLSLITLVENAVQHGIDPTENGGLIEVRASRAGSKVLLQVIDSGAGLNSTDRAGNGTGLQNLRERLNILYGGDATLNLEPNDPTGVVASLSIPIDP
jgi:sensor histidine kinase YesM